MNARPIVDAENIKGFFGEYRFLSNFWPCHVDFEGAVYPSAENAYQAAKTQLTELRAPFMLPSMTAVEAKRKGKALEIRQDWEAIKLDVMGEIVMSKFLLNPDLRKQLLATEPKKLEETNYWGDTFWGVCRGKGLNYLGRILINTRMYLQNHENMVKNYQYLRRLARGD